MNTNMDPTLLLHAYNWALSHGYDPNIDKSNNSPMIISNNIPITTNTNIYGQMHRSAITDINTQISDIKSPPSVFECMVAGTIPCTPIYSDNICGVVVDSNPQAPLHLLIFPKQKEGMERITSITDEMHGSLLGHMIVVAKVN